MTTQLINLDEIATQEVKKIRYNGQEYVVAEMDVRRFIEITKAQKAFAAAIDANDPEAIFLTAEQIAAVAIPTLPPDVLKTFSIKQLMATVELIMLGARPAEDQAAAGEGNAPATE